MESEVQVQSPKSAGGYDDLKLLCESALNQKTGAARLDYWQDYHAQLVMAGKHFCRPRAPRCDECPLKPLLPLRSKFRDQLPLVFAAFPANFCESPA